MAEKREALKNNYRSYPNGFEFALSLWEESIKILNTQLNGWLALGQNYTNTVREFYENLPKATTPRRDSKIINSQFDRLVAFQRSYIDLVRGFSDKFMKETINLSQKNTEKAFSFFDSYFNLFNK
jgi:hypothetical protein